MADQPTPGAFDALTLLRTLTQHGVRFVVIGGISGRLQGSPTVTVDLDICHDRRPDNLERLATALDELKARLRDLPPTLPFRVDARALDAADTFTLTTTAGDLDLLATPAGVDGYDDLEARAVSLEIDDLMVRVCSLDDLIRMKRAAGRPKDRIEVEVLLALKDESERSGRPGA